MDYFVTSEIVNQSQLFQEVIDLLDIAIFFKDTHHRYIGVNKYYSDFLNIAPKDLIGKNDFTIFPKEKAIRFLRINNEVMRERKVLNYQEWVIRGEEKILAHVIKKPLLDAKKNVIGVVTIARDITQEYLLAKEIEKKNVLLLQQNKTTALMEMLQNIAHQWRQPLNSLGLLFQKIDTYYQNNSLTSSKLEEILKDAKLTLQEMSQTVEDFKNFYTTTKTKQLFSLQLVLKKVLIILAPSLQQNKIEVDFLLEHDCQFYGYENEFLQVVLNILSNAIEILILRKVASPKIFIKTMCNKKSAQLLIEDNGGGIEKEVFLRLFEPNVSTKQQGSGIGLYLSKIMIQEHMDGKIQAFNTKKGALFKISLPRFK